MILGFIDNLRRRYRILIERSNYVFLCSHMRGYTSLFSHIIGSHPEIKGYSEMHQSYTSNYSLVQLRFKSKLTTKSLETPRFLFDKLLHDDYKIKGSILRKRNVYPIIMIREPEATMRSIINMGQTMTKVVSWYKDEEKVADYYCTRLKSLETIAKQAKGSIPFFTGEELIHQPEEVLATVTSYLQLRQPLTEDYETFSLTGTMGMGDPSEHIKKGSIIQKREKYDHISLTEEVTDRVNRQYESTKTLLESICITI